MFVQNPFLFYLCLQATFPKEKRLNIEPESYLWHFRNNLQWT